MHAVRRRELDAVLVLKLSDFAQSTRDLLCALEQLKKHNVRFISVREGIDTSTAMGEFFLPTVHTIVEFEHTIHRERICEGLTRAAGKGNDWVGVPKAQIIRFPNSKTI